MPKSELPRLTISFMDRNYKYLKLLCAVMDTSATQILNDILAYLSDNVDERKIWDDWKENYDDFKDRMEEAEDESESEDEAEDESESEDEAEDESESEDEEEE